MDKFFTLKYLQAQVRENRFLDPRTKPTYEQDQEEKAKIKIKAQSLNREIHPKNRSGFSSYVKLSEISRVVGPKKGRSKFSILTKLNHIILDFLPLRGC